GREQSGADSGRRRRGRTNRRIRQPGGCSTRGVRAFRRSRKHTHRRGDEVSGKADYTEQEWHTVLQGPPSAGMIVIMAQRGGTFRETIAMGKAYAEARKQHGAGELLDEILAAKPEIDRSH